MIALGFLILTITSSWAADLKCTKPPTVTIYTGKADLSEDVQLVFRTSLASGAPDEVKSVKITDHDGSIALMSALYLSQDSGQLPEDKSNALILAALKKRLAYFKAEVDRPGNADRKTLMQNSIQSMEYMLRADKTTFSLKDRKQMVSADLGLIAEVEGGGKIKPTIYAYKEFKDGKYTSQEAKKLSDILPPEFYKTALSTSNSGMLDFKAPGLVSCEFLPIAGGMAVQGPPAPPKASGGTAAPSAAKVPGTN